MWILKNEKNEIIAKSEINYFGDGGIETDMNIIRGKSGKLYFENEIPEDEKITDADIFLSKKNEIIYHLNQLTEMVLNSCYNEYSTNEVDSFSIQRAQALEYQKNPDSDNLNFISVLAKNRGIELGELVEKILKKVQIFDEKTAAVLGISSQIRDQIQKTSSLEELLDIDWSTKLNEFIKKM